jgi:hypothetical protein
VLREGVAVQLGRVQLVGDLGERHCEGHQLVSGEGDGGSPGRAHVQRRVKRPGEHFLGERPGLVGAPGEHWLVGGYLDEKRPPADGVGHGAKGQQLGQVVRSVWWSVCTGFLLLVVLRPTVAVASPFRDGWGVQAKFSISS